MSIATEKDWRKEFGIGDAEPTTFFASKAALNTPGANASQSHILRRAFDLLKLDGVLCTENTPLVYFKQVKQIEAAEVARLHRTFWNHGGAPILVLVAPDQVHVYSGLIRPLPQTDPDRNVPGFVETLDRASSALREFLPAVESGEFFRRHQNSFNPAHRVDRDLLDNLQATREKLVATSTGKLDAKVLDALLCRLVFACYLFDRGVVGETYLRGIGLRRAGHLRDVLGLQPRTKAKRYLYDLFRKLGKDFNGDLFSDNLDAEARLVSSSYIDPLDDFFRATDVLSGQSSFWPYDFGVIPVEAISAIYERFLKGADKREGAFYTPRFLAELVLDVALAKTPTLLGHRYLDPACGSGIFLVGLFNRIAEEWKQANPEARNDRRARELRKILCGNLYGVDINPTACRITAFSLYLAYLDQLAPRDIQELQQKGHKLRYPRHRVSDLLVVKSPGKT
jgi:N-6 DNA Methylase